MQTPPLDELLRQASALKAAQLAPDRAAFDAHPSWLRSSLFSTLDVVEVREALSFSVKLQASTDFKTKGNHYSNEGDWQKAVHEYEKALAIWEWIESKLKDWKQHAIRDEDLTHRQFSPETERQGAAVNAVQTSCLLNLAHCHLQLRQFPFAVEACDAVLARDPHNAKALYRRALARSTPLSAGTLDQRQALRDAEQARTLLPQDANVAKLHAQLKSDLQKQLLTDRSRFGDLFRRPEYAEREDEPASATNASPATVTSSSSAPASRLGELKLRDLEVMLVAVNAQLDATADLAEAKRLHKKRAVLESAIAHVRKGREGSVGVDEADAPPEDFAHPTPTMVAEAKKHGLDLDDDRVRQLLANLQKQGPPAPGESISDRLDQMLREIYAAETHNLVQKVMQDLAPADLRAMLEHRLAPLPADPRPTVQGSCGPALSDEEVVSELGRLLHLEYVALYIRFYKEQRDESEWVGSVLEVLQRYHAQSLDGEGASVANPSATAKARLWTLGMWLAGFLVLQLLVYGYRISAQPRV